MSKENELMSFLYENIFNPILDSRITSNSLKFDARLSILEMKDLDAKEMIQYCQSSIIGTIGSTEFARLMKDEGFTKFDEIINEFQNKFNDNWLNL